MFGLALSDLLFAALFSYFVALVLALVSVRFAIPLQMKRGFYGRDQNKLSKPNIAEPLGFVVFCSLIVAIIVTLILPFQISFTEFTHLLGAMLSIALVILIGLYDDRATVKKGRGIGYKMHALLLVAASLPFVVLYRGPDTIYFPIVGAVGFGVFYRFVLIPLGVTGAANASNMFAGLNGLEAGSTAIMSFFLLIMALMVKSAGATLLSAALLGVMVAFILYNRYPARAFGGDSLTLPSGATIALIAMVSKLEFFVALMFLPHYVNSALTFRAMLVAKLKGDASFKPLSFGTPDKRGRLHPKTYAGFYTHLTHVVMALGERFGGFSEQKVVLILLAIQLLAALLGFLFFLLFVPLGC
jgi:UDP-N-acetylglucosamine--dolichyl-phosphate N-acetylglucosaminephosphotransferase